MNDSKTTRRDFIQASAGAAAAVALTGKFTGTYAKEPRAVSKRKPIMVHHEWGTLKEVFVGVPNIRLPSKLAEAPKRFLPDSSVEFIEKNAGRRLEECAREANEQFVRQVNGIIKILKSRGIVVHQVKKHIPSEEAFLAEMNDTVLQTYPRDPMLVIGNRFIETAMFEPNRRKERFAIRRTIGERLANSNARIISMPEPEPFPADENGKYGPGPFLEGGDVMLVGHDIYVGNTGNASNSAGIRWLRNCLGKKYRVHEVPLSDHFLHLDCVLALPRPGLAVICKEAFVKGIPEFLKDWKLIEVSAEDAEKKLGCNGLVLNKKTMIVGDDMPELARALRAEDTEVLTARTVMRDSEPPACSLRLSGGEVAPRSRRETVPRMPHLLKDIRRTFSRSVDGHQRRGGRLRDRRARPNPLSRPVPPPILRFGGRPAGLHNGERQ